VESGVRTDTGEVPGSTPERTHGADCEQWIGAGIVGGLDNLTHSLFGALLARGFARRTPHATLTLVLASNAPDIDAIAALTGGSLGYLDVHRGPTHGPLGFVGLALLTGIAMHGWTLWRARRRGERVPAPARRLARLCGLALVGVTFHALMDLPTSYGTRILSPFVETWYAFDWMPIIDIYLWAILIGALAWCRRRPQAASRIAAAALAVMALDYAGRAVLHQRALADGAARTAAGHESPCGERPTFVRYPRVVEAAAAGPSACIEAAALPTFISPFSWRIVRQYPHGYEISERSVLGSNDDVPAAWIRSDANPWTARARATATARVFLDFSRFPASRIVQQTGEGVVVRLDDVRFIGNPIRLEPEPRGRSPFTATIALDAEGRVVSERLGD
jgi:inner membrane protein